MSNGLSILSHDDLISTFGAGARELRNAVSDLSHVELTTRIAPGTWSILEVLCHIVDFEIINAERVRRVLSEHEPTLFNGEPHDFERALLYNTRNFQEELTLIQILRSQTARIIRCIPDEAWKRQGIHSTDGPLSLRQIIERITRHIPHHVEFIQQKRITLAAQK
jgi:uncharacterized damage-inducible protein DinB